MLYYFQLFGSYGTKHFHPKLMELISDRDDTDAIEFIKNAADIYNPSRLTDESGSTLLHHTAREGNEVITTYLLSLNFNVNALDRQGNTPLAIAVSKNHVSTTEILLKANSNIHVKIGKGQSLVQSIFDGTIKCYSHIIEMFMYKLTSEYKDINLQAMALIETKCPMYYVMSLKNPTITKIMLSHGCVVNNRDLRYGNSPLHKAVYFKDIENVKLLLSYGADVNIKDNRGKIAWRCAVNSDGSIVELNVLKLLLARKPMLTSLTVNGRMQMYDLFVRGCEAAVSMILQSGIDLSGKDDEGNTIFHYLARNNNLSGSKLLPVGNYNVDLWNQTKLTALHIAAINGNSGAMLFLLNNGANVDAKTGDQGFSPLLCVVKETTIVKKNRCVEVLLERRADIQFVTQDNKSVFDMMENCDSSVVRILLAHIAMIDSRGMTILPVVRDKIDNNEEYKSQFNWYKKQLDAMKCDQIHESLTLFELLVDEKRNIEQKFCYKELQLKLKSQNNNNNYSFDPYYNNMLRRRINRAVKMVELFE